MIRRNNSTDAVSISTGYIINLGVATIAVSIFLLLLQGVFADVTETASETQTSVVGEKLAEEIESVDRLAKKTGDGSPTAEVNLPTFETAYSVTVRADSEGNGTVTVASGTGTTVNATFTNSSSIRNASEGVELNSGNDVTLRYESTGEDLKDGELVIG